MSWARWTWVVPILLSLIMPVGARAADPSFGFEAPNILLAGQTRRVSVSFSQAVRPADIVVTITGAARFLAFTRTSCPSSSQPGVCSFPGVPPSPCCAASREPPTQVVDFTVQGSYPGRYVVSVAARTPAVPERTLGRFVRTVTAKPRVGQLVVAPTNADFGRVETADVLAPIDQAGTVRLPALVRANGPVELATRTKSGGDAVSTLSAGVATITQTAAGQLSVVPEGQPTSCRVAPSAKAAAARRRKRRRFGNGGRYRYANVQRRSGLATSTDTPGAPPAPTPPSLSQRFATQVRRLGLLGGPVFDLHRATPFQVQIPDGQVGAVNGEVVFQQDCDGRALLAASRAALTTGARGPIRVYDTEHLGSALRGRLTSSRMLQYRVADQVLQLNGR